MARRSRRPIRRKKRRVLPRKRSSAKRLDQAERMEGIEPPLTQGILEEFEPSALLDGPVDISK